MRHITVADIGTCSIKVVMGELGEGVTSLAGVGKSKSKGVKNGRIVKPSRAGKSLKEAAERAEEMASRQIQSIHFGVGGDRLRLSTNEATVTISSEDRIVGQRDISRLEDLVSSVEVGINEKIISTIPQGFTLDGQQGVTNPVGLQGRRLEVDATLVTVEDKWVNNYRETTSRAGYQFAGLLPLPQCMGSLLMTEEEMKRGKTLIDFGMETTELLIFKEGELVEQLTSSLGGKNLTDDLSAKLNVTREKARRIKHKFDLSEPGNERKNSRRIEEKRKSSERKKQEAIFSALTARTQEIFDLILSRARERGHNQLLSYGLKITGGSARQNGLIEFLNDTFDPAFERGTPIRPVVGIKDVVKDPSYGPVLGLLYYSAGKETEGGETGTFKATKTRLSTWIRDRLRTFFSIYFCI
ncbi:cell division protein FtsA [Candidatus Bipolaricaulota bacterium]|nr:cell division protein FtsA [Candidatus Bipolaricaulota bacterium]